MANLDKIKNIVIVMMENRSFDHMLGYLSLPPFNRDVEGLKNDPNWLAQFANVDKGQRFECFLSDNPYTLPEKFDPPHGRENVAMNLGDFQNGKYAMDGFVKSIPDKVSTNPNDRKLVMSYFGAEQVPINHFFAEHFAICDHWFCSLPAGTQANRLMAMSGFSKIENNTVPLPNQELVYDWLTERGISWRVYHQGIPFFALMLKWVPAILGSEHFRSFDDLESDITNTPPHELPQVIFVEPTYGDAPHINFCTDDHAPSGVSNGQEFLMRVYNAVSKSRSFWKNSALIISYDEHGGFFDHVSPPLIRTEPPEPGLYPPFESLGVRTPAFVISPFVKPGSVNHTLLDHTSILKFLGEKFGNGSYSPIVDARPVGSVSDALNFDAPITTPPVIPPVNDYLAKRPPAPSGATVPPQDTELQKAFTRAVNELKAKGADEKHKKFGPLLTELVKPQQPKA